MPAFSGFCDLCVNSDDTDPQTLRRILLRLHELGYETVAINQTIDESIFGNEKKKKKKGTETEIVKSSVPDPLDVTELKTEFEKKLTIFSRITFAFGDAAKVHTLGQSQNLKKYDIYAVIPKTQAALQFACSQLNADIVTIKSCNPSVKFSRKLYLQAVERGIHFEIQYADILKPATRKYAIHSSHLFHIFGKSKNIIISSGAMDENLLRNPYDIINLASLLGLNESKAKASILAQSQHLLLKAEGRRYGKAIFSISTNADNTRTREEGLEGSSSKRKKMELYE